MPAMIRLCGFGCCTWPWSRSFGGWRCAREATQRRRWSYSFCSTLRRTLAGLLASEGYRTTWTDRVVLIPQDETRLTAWMYAHLRLTWAKDADLVSGQR